MKKLQAFIPAAGYGERLRPITDHIPKPLLPILGKPVIETVLEKLAGIPVDSFGINTHHKSEMLIRWSELSPHSKIITLFHEKTLLGTGGALKYAEHFLKKSPFIVHNADILSDISLEKLVEEHFLSENAGTLAVHNHEQFNNLIIEDNGKLKGIEKTKKKYNPGLCKIAFTGIAIYSPDFLEFLPEGNSSVVDAWLEALNAGRKIGTVDFSGCFWTDIGTPDAYASAVFDTLKKIGETIYVHPSVDCSNTAIEGNVSFEEGCVTGAGTYIKNCVLLPGTQVPDGATLEDAVAGPNYIIRIKKAKDRATFHFSEKMLDNFFEGPQTDMEFTLIGTGGSDRKYYRVHTRKKSAVLMVCAADDPDYDRHIAYTEFFRKHSLPVPALFEKDRQQKQALFEDLGDLSLYAWLKCRREPAIVESMYRKVLDIQVQLHIRVSTKRADCPLPVGHRIFDFEHLRWETSYFSERFLDGLMGMLINDQGKLDKELMGLAKTVDAFPKTLVHRDFQSQNIMITRDGLPRVIDYQGARLGPPAYDLASALWDPYFRLEDALRERLVAYYIETSRAVLPQNFDEDAFRYSLLLCRLQRHMQALGAYAFLSRVKGKNYFLKYIPRAISYLSDETARTQKEYPALYELVMELKAAYDRKSSDG